MENKGKFVLTKKCRKSIVTPRNLEPEEASSFIVTFEKNKTFYLVRHSFLNLHVTLCFFFPSN